MNTRLAAASLVSVFWLIAEAGQHTAGFVGMTSTVLCQTAIDAAHMIRRNRR